MTTHFAPNGTAEHAAHFSNPEAIATSYEAEWEAHFSNPESHFSNPETHYSTPESEWEDEGEGFLPLIPLAMGALKSLALPALKGVAKAGIKKLLPQAKRMAGQVARNVLSGGGRPQPRPSSQPTRPPQRRPMSGGAPVFGGASAGGSAAQSSQTVAGLFAQLSRIFGQAESEAEAQEAAMFGANEAEGEIAAHEAAHEAALTEVMAAEASHSESESEAEALLGAALPVTIRIMGGQRALRQVTPALAVANANLVRSLHGQGGAGRQLLRTVPSIQRRTVAGLRVAQRAGRPITPALATQIMAGQAAHVLGTPAVCGRALARNVTIRQATVRRPRRNGY